MKTIYTIFKDNLAKAEMLSDVFMFNASSVVEEFNFILGQNDKAQWNVSIIKLSQTRLSYYNVTTRLVELVGLG